MLYLKVQLKTVLYLNVRKKKNFTQIRNEMYCVLRLIYI